MDGWLQAAEAASEYELKTRALRDLLQSVLAGHIPAPGTQKLRAGTRFIGEHTAMITLLVSPDAGVRGDESLRRDRHEHATHISRCTDTWLNDR